MELAHPGDDCPNLALDSNAIIRAPLPALPSNTRRSPTRPRVPIYSPFPTPHQMTWGARLHLRPRWRLLLLEDAFGMQIDGRRRGGRGRGRRRMGAGLCIWRARHAERSDRAEEMLSGEGIWVDVGGGEDKDGAPFIALVLPPHPHTRGLIPLVRGTACVPSVRPRPGLPIPPHLYDSGIGMEGRQQGGTGAGWRQARGMEMEAGAVWLLSRVSASPRRRLVEGTPARGPGFYSPYLLFEISEGAMKLAQPGDAPPVLLTAAVCKLPIRMQTGSASGAPINIYSRNHVRDRIGAARRRSTSNGLQIAGFLGFRVALDSNADYSIVICCFTPSESLRE
ncbi:hypothetical protein B0H16DRAFT_1686610 [Mycena metata]|uniref:Uncharacterized protein n=1 Tax=Mycena metata TaxID=1033252 RepID=A0AAD7JQV3_9AGAR|nr:hypothetical protein B0H16DRAFT_1686610 [Mycena metata]